MVDMGKNVVFLSNFDVPWPFTPCKTELPRKTESQCQMAERTICNEAKIASTFLAFKCKL